jgi:YVTN family beta-propeller protein
MTASPALTEAASPTLPGQPQLVGEIALIELPGVGHSPQALAALGGKIYVANRGTDNVSVVEGDRVVAVIQVGKTPVAVAADPTTHLVYVAHETDSSIGILSGDRLVKTVPAPKSPACLVALDGRLYVGARGENSLAVLDGASGERIGTIPLQASIGVLALAVNPTNHLLYASVYTAVEIVDLQAQKVVGRLEHDVYMTLAADPGSERFFVSEYESSSNTQYLVAYDALGKQKLGRVLIGGDPRGMAVSAQDGRIYVANSWSNDVSVIDGRAMRLVTTVPVGLQPVDVVLGKAGEVYVANSSSDNLAILDGSTGRLQKVVPISALPRGMAVQPSTGRVYVACASSNSVLALQNGQVVSQIPVGLHPTEVGLSPDGYTLFILDYVDGSLVSASTQDNRVIRSLQVDRLTRGLSVASESGNLYAGDVVLDRADLHILRQTELTTMYGLSVKPVRSLIDAQAGRVYMVASNGVPGSNGGLIVYITDLQGKRIEGQVGGLSMTGIALGSEEQLIFSTTARSSSYSLLVDDASRLQRVATLDLTAYPAAVTYNPHTHHIFVCLTNSTWAMPATAPQVWVLDSRSLGTVARLSLPEGIGLYDSYEFAVDAQRGYVYLSDTYRGSVHVLRDMVLPVPPSPVPTSTPTPWPTLTPQPVPRSTASAEPTCTQATAARFQSLWASASALRLGLRCPTQAGQSGLIAEQAFERGLMLWREADRTVFVLYKDGQWRSFADRWQEGMSIYSCEGTAPADLLRPQRGFGLVWCAEQGVKEGLGWAVGDEKGYTDTWQLFEQGQMIVLGGQPSVYALLSDGTFLQHPAP